VSSNVAQNNPLICDISGLRIEFVPVPLPLTREKSAKKIGSVIDNLAYFAD